MEQQVIVERSVAEARGQEDIAIKGDSELKSSTFEARLAQTRERLRQFITPGRSLSDELIAERRAEARREEAGL